MNKTLLIITLILGTLAIPQTALARKGPAQFCPNAADYIDPTYGGKIRQLGKSDGHEHNLYYHRDPWNADNSYMVGIQSTLQQEDWRIALYDGKGCFIKELFTITQYDWRLVWDRHDSGLLYTWKGSNLYQYNVHTGAAKLLKSFSPLRLVPNGPSLNQAGDRILVVTSDRVFRSYLLPDMSDERAFKIPSLPSNCDMRNVRYVGHQNYIAVGCRNSEDAETLIYKDTGVLFHTFASGLGHTDFSPDGQWAYGRMWKGGRRGGGNPLEIRVVNLDGTNDRVLYSVPQREAARVQSFHVSWPDRVNDWFVVSFFPSARNLPSTYAPPLDEILLITTSGKHEFIARTGTSIGGRREFWAQSLASPSSDGTRISFNSNRSGTFDQYILWVPTNLRHSKVTSILSLRPR